MTLHKRGKSYEQLWENLIQGRCRALCNPLRNALRVDASRDATCMADYARSLLTRDSGFGGARQDSVTRKRFIRGSARRSRFSFNAKKKNFQGWEVTCVTFFYGKYENKRVSQQGQRDDETVNRRLIQVPDLPPPPAHLWNDAMTSRAVMSFIKIFPDRCSGKPAVA